MTDEGVDRCNFCGVGIVEVEVPINDGGAVLLMCRPCAEARLHHSPQEKP